MTGEIRSIYRFSIEARIQLDQHFAPIARYTLGGYDVEASYRADGWVCNVARVTGFHYEQGRLVIDTETIRSGSVAHDRAFNVVAPYIGVMFRDAQVGERDWHIEYEDNL